jgi:hypothetical protein
VGDSQEVAEAFLAVEVAFREEITISLEVREVFPEVAAVSLAVAVLLIAAVFLAAAVVSPEVETVFPVVEAGAFPAAAAILFNAETAAVLLGRTGLRKILHCSPTSADRDRVAAECRPVRPEVNRAVVVNRWEEALHNCRPEIEPRKFPLAMKATYEHV